MNFEEKIIERLKRLEREVERLRVKERPAGESGVTDHGALTGLADNDHPQYLLTTAKAADSDKLDGKTLAQVMLSIYPVGAIFISSASTNPGTLFGGTWVAYGQGRVLVGKATSGTFATAGSTGGAETHSHGLSDAGIAKIGTVGGTNVHIHRASLFHNWTSSNVAVANSTGTGTSLNYGAGLGGATDSDSTLQPYIVVYMWRRTG